MKALILLSETAQSAFAVWYGALMVVSVFRLLRLLLRKSYKPALGVALLLVAEYTVLQSMFLLNAYNEKKIVLDRFASAFSALPWLAVAGIAAGLTAVQICGAVSVVRWTNTHVTEHSIKEGLDALPMGICWYRESGYIVMKNRTMEELYGALTGNDLQSGSELDAVLKERAAAYASVSDISGLLVRAEINGAESFWSVSVREFSDGLKYRELLAVNVTEEYGQTRVLTEKKQQLEELNDRLTGYSREIVDTITAQEILNAKIKIHDEMGQLLLASKKYLLRGGSAEEKSRLISSLKTNLELMKGVRGKNRSDHLEMLKEAASDMGIRLSIDGVFPEDELRREILITAIHENLTNTIKHARGDALMVRIRPVQTEGRLLAVFENNGITPEGKIEEKGGLGSLRRIVEDAGGSMRILSENRFRMEIEL